MSNDAEEEKKQELIEIKGSLLNEQSKNPWKQIIFGNVFAILINHILANSLEDQIGPSLQVLTNTVNHLPLWLFSSDESMMELSSEMFIMKNQIYDLINSKTVGSLYELLFWEGP